MPAPPPARARRAAAAGVVRRAVRRDRRLVVRMGVGEPPRGHHDPRVRQGGAALAGRAGPGADVFEAASLALGHRIAFDPFEPSRGNRRAAAEARARRRAGRQKKSAAHDGDGGVDADLDVVEGAPDVDVIARGAARMLAWIAAATGASAGRSAGAPARSSTAAPASTRVTAPPSARPRHRGGRDAAHRRPARGPAPVPLRGRDRRPAAQGARAPRSAARSASCWTTATRCTPSAPSSGEGARLPPARGRHRPRRPGRPRRLPERRARGDRRAAADRERAPRRPALDEVPLSGRTPLADALRRARFVLRRSCSSGRPRAARRDRQRRPADPAAARRRRSGRDALGEAHRCAARTSRCVVVDASGPALAAELCRAARRGQRRRARALRRRDRRRDRRLVTGGAPCNGRRDRVIELDAGEAALLEALRDPRIPDDRVPVTPEQRAAWEALADGRPPPRCGRSRASAASSGRARRRRRARSSRPSPSTRTRSSTTSQCSSAAPTG